MFLKQATLIRLKLMINPTYIISMILIPLLLAFILISYKGNFTNIINVGILYDSKYLEDNIQHTLELYADDSINFVFFENENEMKEKVMDYSIDSGYYFTEKLKTNNNSSIVVYKTETTTSTKTLNILIASIVMQNKSGELGYNVLKKHLDKTTDENIIKNEILENSYLYTKDGPLMDITYEFINLPAHASKPIFSMDNIFYGVLSIVALYTTILNSGRIIREKNSSIFSRLKINTNNIKIYFASFFLASFLLNFIFLSLSQFILGIIYKPTFNIFNILILNIVYSLCISAFSTFLAVFLRKDSIVEALSVFIFLLSIVFGGIIFNISEIFSFLNPVKYLFFVTYYIDGLSNNTFLFNISILGACFIVFCMISFLKVLRIR